jgi:hypothetical protein
MVAGPIGDDYLREGVSGLKIGKTDAAYPVVSVHKYG